MMRNAAQNEPDNINFAKDNGFAFDIKYVSRLFGSQEVLGFGYSQASFMNTDRILIVDDDPNVIKLLTLALRKDGYDAEGADSGIKALDHVRNKPPRLVLLDLNLPDLSGLVVLERILRISPSASIVMMTGDGDIGTAVQAMKLGARDFLTKPFQADRLNSTLQSLLHPSTGSFTGSIVGTSPQMREVWSQISRYARPDVSILLVGESGTGKELFARAIHAQSKRSAKPLVALDCAALPESLVESELFGHEKGAFTGASEQKIGKFELAQGGTIFLDETGNLPLNFQAKLLRVVQERYVDRLGGQKSIPVDVRIVSATNLDLEQAIQKGAFREDLYYRLAEVVIRIPPLREREGDIDRLATHFVERSNRRFGRQIRGISDAAWTLLREYRWPGNVRELENTIRASVLAAEDLIEPACLPEYLRRSVSKPEAEIATDYYRALVCHQIDSGLENSALDLKALVAGFNDQIECAVFVELLGRRRYTQNELCTLLKVDPKTLRAKLKKYDLHNNCPQPQPEKGALS